MSEERQTSDPVTRFTIRARLRSFVFAGRGLRRLVKEEHNAWAHGAASVLAITAATALHVSMADWRWIIVAMAMVWVAEAFNTAIEDLCDRVCLDHDPVIGRIKDLAAGGVLAASVAAALIGMLTLLPALARGMS